MRFLIVLLILVAAVPSIAFSDDKLISYDPSASIITIDRSGQLKTYRVKPLTELTLNGEKATFDKLAPGMKLNITLSDPQTVSKIAVQVARLPKSNGRSIVLRMRVDGSDIVRVRDGQLTIEHGSWNRPSEILVNGKEWMPKWEGKMTEPFNAFDPPLLPFGQSRPFFKQVLGRSAVAMDKMPQGNFEKILTIRYNDRKPGADLYEIHVSW